MADGSPTATELNVVENVDKNAQKENDIGEEMNVLRGCYERWQVGHASGEIGYDVPLFGQAVHCLLYSASTSYFS